MPTHAPYLDKLGVPQLLHDGGLLEKVCRVHRARLECLHSDRGGAVPHALPHVAKLPRAQLAIQADGVAGDLPLYRKRMCSR